MEIEEDVIKKYDLLTKKEVEMFRQVMNIRRLEVACCSTCANVKYECNPEPKFFCRLILNFAETHPLKFGYCCHKSLARVKRFDICESGYVNICEDENEQ